MGSNSHAAKNLDKSVNLPAEAVGVEYFWSTELTSDKKTSVWVVPDEDLDDEEDDDFINHTLFLKMAVLGADAADDQSNVVFLESKDCHGKTVKGAIVHLKKGAGSLMCQLDLSLSGKQGATFTLEGSGPVFISGNYLQEFPKEIADLTQTDMSAVDLDDSNDAEMCVDEEVSEEEEVDTKKTATKRKTSQSKNKQKKAKQDEDGEEEEEEEDDEEDEDDDDEDYEEKTTKKVGKKGAKVADVAKKTGKKVKK